MIPPGETIASIVFTVFISLWGWYRSWQKKQVAQRNPASLPHLEAKATEAIVSTYADLLARVNDQSDRLQSLLERVNLQERRIAEMERRIQELETELEAKTRQVRDLETLVGDNAILIERLTREKADLQLRLDAAIRERDIAQTEVLALRLRVQAT